MDQRFFANSSESAALDRFTTETTGVPSRSLMEIAGFSAARLLGELAPPRARIGVIVGRGNNGGDASVLARCVRSIGGDVAAFLLCPPGSIRSVDARENARLLPRYGIPVTILDPEGPLQDLDPFEVLVDGILGTGLRGPVRPADGRVIEAVNRRRAQVLALDVPSGLCPDTGIPLGECVFAQDTITFGTLKPGLFAGDGPRHAGRVTFTPLPFSQEAWDHVAPGRGPLRTPTGPSPA